MCQMGIYKTQNKHMNNKFTTKQEYLDYRSNWKSEYKKTSQIIRDLRYIDKEYARAYNKAWMSTSTDYTGNWRSKFYNRTLEILNENKKYQELTLKYKPMVGNTKAYKALATDMLNELKEAKVEAQRQYLESKQQLILT